jgi:hypothetical protein
MNVVIIFLQLKLKVVEGTRAKESSVSSLGFTGPSRNAVRRKSGSREGDCFHRDGMESQRLSIRVIAAMATTCTWWCRCGWTSPESPRDGRDAWRSVAGGECGRPPAGEENRVMGILHGTVQRHGARGVSILAMWIGCGWRLRVCDHESSALQDLLQDTDFTFFLRMETDFTCCCGLKAQPRERVPEN